MTLTPPGVDSSGLHFRSLPIAIQAEAMAAGEWLIGRLQTYALTVGYEFNEWDEWALRHGPFDISRLIQVESMGSIVRSKELERAYRQSYFAMINGCVTLARNAMEQEKRRGVETVMARTDLCVPAAWEDRYELIYETELPWSISVVLQNAFMGNPFAGEKRPWKSRWARA